MMAPLTLPSARGGDSAGDFVLGGLGGAHCIGDMGLCGVSSPCAYSALLCLISHGIMARGTRAGPCLLALPRLRVVLTQNFFMTSKSSRRVTHGEACFCLTLALSRVARRRVADK